MTKRKITMNMWCANCEKFIYEYISYKEFDTNTIRYGVEVYVKEGKNKKFLNTYYYHFTYYND